MRLKKTYSRLTRLRHGAWVVALFLLAPALSAQDGTEGGVRTEERGPKSASFEDYGVILDRNIFSPDRRPGVSSWRDGSTSSTMSSSQSSTSTVTAATDYVDLLGTLIADTRGVAFIGGRTGTLGSQIGVGAKLGDWEVASIVTQGITLERDDQHMDWPVGRRLERVEGGDWRLSDAPVSPVSSDSSTSGSAVGEANSSGPSSLLDKVQEMIQRRKREMGR